MPSTQTGQSEQNKNHPTRQRLRAGALAIALGLSGALVACTSGGGGDNGNGNKGEGPGVSNPGKSGGLIFSYPVDGQTDVYSGSQIAFAFAGDASGKVKLVDADGHTVATKLINQGNGIFNLRVVDSDAALTSNTRYAVKADGKIGSGNTRFKNGQTLFSFTTAPAPGAASKKGFQIVSHRGDKNDRFPFTQFNPIRAKFSESVDEGTVKLCTGNEALGDDNCTVAITGPNGNVPGRLTVLGRDFVFDPGAGHVPITSNDASDYADQDLAANTSYKVAFSKQVHSAFGESLPSSKRSFSVTPVSIGKDVIQRLSIGDAGSGNNPLNGRTRNNVELASELIGSYDLAASPLPNRGGLKVRLAAPGKADYKNTFPTLLPRGQAFQLSSLKLKLGSQLQSDGTYSKGQVNTPVNLDNLTIQFANDVDAFITANDLRNIEKPTRVQLRLDLNITGTVPSGNPVASLANGAVNQTALNIIASGIAVPQDNGDVSLVTLGSFPIAVNRTGRATTNFELELTLPNSAKDQPDVRGDQTAPFITAQYPSGCFYTFNTAAFDGAVDQSTGGTPLSAPEADCVDVLSQRDIRPTTDGSFYDFPDPRANSLPLNANPSITFSEAVDPLSLAGNITLTDVASGSAVPVRLRSEGSSVVVYPLSPLSPDAQYTLNVGNGVTDLAGNGLTGNFPGSTVVSDITFNTEPMVVPTDANSQPSDIDPTQREAVRQTAPFLTVLTPGIPCALDPATGNYLGGGSTAGRCVGDAPSDSPTVIPAGPFGGDPATIPASPTRDYPVFSQPANNTVNAYFSKPVKADTVQLADGCLIGGSGNTNAQATVAIQTMDGSGHCTGVVPGDLALLTPGDALTRGFSFRPTNDFESGQRYWIVVCGSANPRDINFSDTSQCSTGHTIHGQSGLALNTSPLRSTGTQTLGDQSVLQDCPYGAYTPIDGGIGECYSDYRGSGGPDIVMPFDGAAATDDFYATTLALPETDTNGNGFFDNTPIDQATANTVDVLIGGTNTGETRGRSYQQFEDTFGREHAQRANSVVAATLSGLIPTAPPETAFLSGGRPVAIRQVASGEVCSSIDVAFDDGTSVIGNATPRSCLPVDLLPGGLTAVSSLAGGGVAPTGRLLLRFPDNLDSNGGVTGPQTGYIVPECQGTTPQGQDYDYQPCFVANLDLTVVGNDGFGAEDKDDPGVKIKQQDINVQVFGPVAFEQNGRLVISTKNANTFAITATLGLGNNVAPLPAPTQPGGQSLQLVGPAIHGGRSFPIR